MMRLSKLWIQGLATKLSATVLPAAFSSRRAAKLLQSLGYLPPESYDDDRFRGAIQRFQRFNRFDIQDGVLSRDVIRKLFAPRCGVRDPDSSRMKVEWRGGIGDVSAGACAWEGKSRGFTLTYWLNHVPKDFEGEVLSAMAEWQSVDGIVSFTRASSQEAADFSITWADDSNLVGNLIALARFPCETQFQPRPILLRINKTGWSITPDQGKFTVYSIVLHEIGHILGLAHPDPSVATMAMDAYFAEYSNKKHLSEGDKNGLRHLYPVVAKIRQPV